VLNQIGVDYAASEVPRFRYEAGHAKGVWEKTMLGDDSADPGRRRAVARSVLGETLDLCSIKPIAGFYRDGCCNNRTSKRRQRSSSLICYVFVPHPLSNLFCLPQIGSSPFGLLAGRVQHTEAK
jgi:Uncharacterized protein conserved in bacteria (DUF2237)